MLNRSTINHNLPQSVLYKAGVKEEAIAIRRTNPDITRRGAKQAAQEVAGETSPQEVRTVGAHRLGRRAIVATTGLVAATGLSAAYLYAVNTDPSLGASHGDTASHHVHNPGTQPDMGDPTTTTIHLNELPHTQ